MPIKDIKGHCTEHGVSERGDLLEEIIHRELTAGTIPRTPFIDHEFYLMSRIELTHGLPVTLNQRFQPTSFMQYFVPVLNLKLNRVALACVPVPGAPPAQIPGIVMERPAKD